MLIISVLINNTMINIKHLKSKKIFINIGLKYAYLLYL